MRKLDELFLNLNILNKNKKSLKKKKLLTDSFDIAMDMFNNEQLNNDYDMEIKNDKYIFCFGTLSSLRYKCFEASFSQTNRINYISLSILCIIPFIRYFFLAEHSNYHNYFTYRCFLPVIMFLLLCIVNTLKDIKKKPIKKKK